MKFYGEDSVDCGCDRRMFDTVLNESRLNIKTHQRCRVGGILSQAGIPMNLATSETVPCVLVVEANMTLAQTISVDLQEAGYCTAVAHDAETGLMQAKVADPALIIIDRMLTGESGLELCAQLRAQGMKTPLLLMMVREQLEDRIACLEAGADDYILKPYRAEDFLDRVNLYLKPTPLDVEHLRFGELTLDVANRTAVRGGRPIDLTMKEFELLRYLMEHPREVLSREQI